MIEIDGSFGEGGGQILRTALSLSCLFIKPLRILNIRAKRKRPGLMPQHLTSVKAVQLISGAEVKGDTVGSLELIFMPDKIRGGHYKFDVGTAGSTSLVFQTILLPLCFSDSESEITITGGTHVPWSPTFHYLRDVFLPLLKNLGIEIYLDIERWGFYPKGGGIIRALIKPAKKVVSIVLEKRGELKSLKGISAVCNLPLSIAERQKASALELLRSYGLNADIEISSVPGIGQGTFFFLLSEFHRVGGEGVFAGFSSLGERGKKAEDVGREAINEFIRFLHSNAPIDKRLADQIVPYLALSSERSSFITSEITQHLLTNVEVVKKFLDVRIEIMGKEGEEGRVIIN